MRVLVLLLTTVFFSTTAFASDLNTVIPTIAKPGIQELRGAISILESAIKAQERRDELSADSFIASAKAQLDTRWTKKVFPAEIYCDSFKAFSDPYGYYEGWSSCRLLEMTICYKGNLEVAHNLLKAAIYVGYWDWDKYWAENPRKEFGKLLVDQYHEYKKLRTTIEVVPCK
ncbi:hypothetical protein ACFLRA_01640 [Bdellovibrionota bacterium]